MSRPSFIEPLMACSTAHITQATMTRITANEPHLVISYPNEHGAFLWVPEDPVHDDDDGSLPNDLRAIFALAREYDCCWVKLDRDAAEIDALPTYEWS